MAKGNGTKWTMNDLKNKGIHVSGDKAEKLIDKTINQVKPKAELIIPDEWANAIFIAFNVPSSKNSRRNFVQHKNDVIQRDAKGKMKSVSLGSELVQTYKKNTIEYWKKHSIEFRVLCQAEKMPYEIEFLFIRDSNRKADFHNLVQLPMDLMQEYGWIDDDDMNTALPYPPDGKVKYIINKDKPGVLIKIRKSNWSLIESKLKNNPMPKHENPPPTPQKKP